MNSKDTKRRRPWRPRVDAGLSSDGQEPMYLANNGELDPFVRTTEPQASIGRTPSFTEQIERIEAESGLSAEAVENAPGGAPGGTVTAISAGSAGKKK